MEEFDGSWFLQTCRFWTALPAASGQSPDDKIANESKNEIKGMLEKLTDKAKECGLKTTVICVRKTLTILGADTCIWKNYFDRVPVIFETLENEIETIKLMRIAANKADYYDNPALFGEDVNRAFRSACFDIREAGNCFAVGRNTACVFHVMRVIESALEEAAKVIGVPLELESESPSWEQILKTIKVRVGQIESTEPKEENWRQKRQFAQIIMERIRSIKDAWRNPVMHVVAQHDEHSARSVLNHTEAFMRDLVKRLAQLRQPVTDILE